VTRTELAAALRRAYYQTNDPADFDGIEEGGWAPVIDVVEAYCARKLAAHASAVAARLREESAGCAAPDWRAAYRAAADLVEALSGLQTARVVTT
jgi:hypothetical protein